MKQKAGETPMDAALKYLTSRPRTVMEMQKHLDGKDYGEYEVYATVTRLQELGYLDDARYAAEFVASRLRTKPVSRAHLERQLLSHEIEPELARRAIADVSDEAELENAVRVAEKYWREGQALPPDARRERVLRRLDARGYCYDTARKALEAAEHGENG